MNTNDAATLISGVLTSLGYNAQNFINLLLGTMAQESAMGQFETQVGGGPARGIFQMENATFQDLNANFLRYHQALNNLVQAYAPQGAVGTADDLVNNHEYATAYAACSYIRHSVPHPDTNATDVMTMYALYKTYYNGPGAATQSEFVNNWNRFGITTATASASLAPATTPDPSAFPTPVPNQADVTSTFPG